MSIKPCGIWGAFAHCGSSVTTTTRPRARQMHSTLAATSSVVPNITDLTDCKDSKPQALLGILLLLWREPELTMQVAQPRSSSQRTRQAFKLENAPSICLVWMSLFKPWKARSRIWRV